MPTFEIDYEYIVPEYGVTTVVADSIDMAEEVALDQLSDSLGPEVKGVSIEAIRELKI